MTMNDLFTEIRKDIGLAAIYEFYAHRFTVVAETDFDMVWQDLGGGDAF